MNFKTWLLWTYGILLGWGTFSVINHRWIEGLVPTQVSPTAVLVTLGLNTLVLGWLIRRALGSRRAQARVKIAD